MSASMDSPSFFKVMIGDFKTTMRIPPMFKNRVSGKIGRSVYWVLRSGSGGGGRGGRRKWKVRMGAEDGQLFFRDGWERFVSDHGISGGDFLVFFYDGHVGFDVKLYDATCCEKRRPHPPPSVKNEDMEPESDSEMISQKISRKRKAAPARSGRAKKSKCYKVMRSVKPAKNDKAMKAACAFKSPHPHFVTTCRSSRTSYMTIPIELAKEHNLDQKDLIVLRDPCGTSWSVKLSSWRDGRRCLSSGWSHFYKRNHLKEGDVCVLEFVQDGAIANVHIFRSEEYGAKSSPESGVKSIPHSDAKTISVSGERLTPEDDKEGVLAAAKSLESHHRKFTVIWRPTRLYHVPIPKKVAAAVGLNSNQRTILSDPSGKSWPVNITVRSYGQVELGVGWSTFSRGHNLALGDVCVFELLGRGEAIKVHINRMGDTNRSATSDIQVAHNSEIPPP